MADHDLAARHAEFHPYVEAGPVGVVPIGPLDEHAAAHDRVVVPVELRRPTTHHGFNPVGKRNVPKPHLQWKCHSLIS